MEEIDQLEIARKYNEIKIIWDENDKWHLRTKKMINDFIIKSLKKIPDYSAFKILNAGSAGYSYGLNEENILHIDIAKEKISSLPNSIVGDIQNVPLNDKFHLIICVGSVINYCDPIKVLSEFKRLNYKNGFAILEFENSYTLELLGKSTFNKKATIIKSFYQGKPEKIWYFSESYIRELAHLHGYEILATKRCHVLSPLIYRICKNEKIAEKYGILDKACSFIPLLRKFSSNTILLLKC